MSIPKSALIKIRAVANFKKAGKMHAADNNKMKEGNAIGYKKPFKREGKINFTSNSGKDVPFGVLSCGKTADSKKEVNKEVYEHLIQWGGRAPKLLVSVLGDIDYYDRSVQDKVHNEFKASLQNLMKKEGVWLLTGTTETRLDELVGKAVERLEVDDRESVVAVGVADLKKIKDGSELKKETNGREVIHYPPSSDDSETTKDELPLERFHTHYILLEDLEEDAYELQFISDFQSRIAQSEFTRAAFQKTRAYLTLTEEGFIGLKKKLKFDINEEDSEGPEREIKSDVNEEGSEGQKTVNKSAAKEKDSKGPKTVNKSAAKGKDSKGPKTVNGVVNEEGSKGENTVNTTDGEISFDDTIKKLFKKKKVEDQKKAVEGALENIITYEKMTRYMEVKDCIEKKARAEKALALDDAFGELKTTLKMSSFEDVIKWFKENEEKKQGLDKLKDIRTEQTKKLKDDIEKINTGDTFNRLKYKLQKSKGDEKMETFDDFIKAFKKEDKDEQKEILEDMRKDLVKELKGHIIKIDTGNEDKKERKRAETALVGLKAKLQESKEGVDKINTIDDVIKAFKAKEPKERDRFLEDFSEKQTKDIREELEGYMPVMDIADKKEKKKAENAIPSDALNRLKTNLQKSRKNAKMNTVDDVIKAFKKKEAKDQERLLEDTSKEQTKHIHEELKCYMEAMNKADGTRVDTDFSEEEKTEMLLTDDAFNRLKTKLQTSNKEIESFDDVIKPFKKKKKDEQKDLVKEVRKEQAGHIHEELKCYFEIMDSTDKIQVVSIVYGGLKDDYGGDKTMIDTISATGSPVIAVRGSGGAADKIANKTETDDENTKLNNVEVCTLEEEDGNSKSTVRLTEAIAKLLFAMQKQKKGIKESKSTGDIKHVIDLALLLGESEVVKEHLKEVEDELKKTDSRNKLLLQALLKNVDGFVELFAESKFDFVDVEKFTKDPQNLESLYKITLENRDRDEITHLLRRKYVDKAMEKEKADSKTPYLDAIEIVVEELTGYGAYSYCYWEKNKEKLKEEKEKEKKNEKEQYQEKKDIEQFQKIDAATHLFIWAVLFNRPEIANFFWKTSNHPHLLNAINASSILYKLANKASEGKEPDLAEELQKHGRLFEKKAGKVLRECSLTSRRDTQLLLSREHWHTFWGSEATVLNAAYRGNCRQFFSNTACQVKLDALWRGRMVWSTHWFMILCTALFPLLIFGIKFRKTEDCCKVLKRNLSIKPNDVTDAEGDSWKSEVGCCFPCGSKPRKGSGYGKKASNDAYRICEGTIPCCTALLYFITAPITKFYYHTIFYVFFLGLFSFVSLTNLSAGILSISIFEWVAWGWILLFIIEECRELYVTRKLWFRVGWNVFDFTLYLWCILTFFLRAFVDKEEFNFARNAVSICLGAFYIRFLRTYYAFPEVGPKVYTILRMIKDLIEFSFILFIIVLGYGVASTVVLFPNRPAKFDLVTYVLYSPFWQMMIRDAYIDHIDGGADESECSRDREVWMENENITQCVEEGTIYADVLLIIYVMLSNVLLLNFLIAMFAATFENTQRHSTTWWHFNRYTLVYEYKDKPVLPPPLIIFTYIHRTIQAMYFSCPTKACCECYKRSPIMHESLKDTENARLTNFERINMEKLMETWKPKKGKKIELTKKKSKKALQ